MLLKMFHMVTPVYCAEILMNTYLRFDCDNPATLYNFANVSELRLAGRVQLGRCASGQRHLKANTSVLTQHQAHHGDPSERSLCLWHFRSASGYNRWLKQALCRRRGRGACSDNYVHHNCACHVDESKKKFRGRKL